MPHIYMHFDFGKDEEKAQLARHKLETWKQAFRLDKKLLYKFERETDGAPDAEPEAAKSEKPKAKSKGKAKDDSEAPASNRIPTEEPFVAASPKVLKPGDAHFADTEKQFEEVNPGGWNRPDARR
jgi:hypothetical protein